MIPPASLASPQPVMTVRPEAKAMPMINVLAPNLSDIWPMTTCPGTRARFIRAIERVPTLLGSCKAFAYAEHQSLSRGISD